MILAQAYVQEVGELEQSWPELRQGDIIDALPFPLSSLSKLNVIVRDESTSEETDLEIRAVDPNTRYVLAQCEVKPGIILSQTCDLERKDRAIIVSPIRNYTDFFEKTVGSRSFLNHIKEIANSGKFPVGFPLPPFVSKDFQLPYSIVDLNVYWTLSPDSRRALIARRRGRLSSEMLTLLQERVANYFGRVAATDGIFLSEEHARATLP